MQPWLSGASRLVCYMRTFGGLSAKPLELWMKFDGKPYLKELHSLMWGMTVTRKTEQLMKQGQRYLVGNLLSKHMGCI